MNKSSGVDNFGSRRHYESRNEMEEILKESLFLKGSKAQLASGGEKVKIEDEERGTDQYNEFVEKN